MKKYIALTMGLLALAYTSPLNGQYSSDGRCLDVCMYTDVNNYYRFVTIQNATTRHLNCLITASNGAHIPFYLPPLTTSRLFRINDANAVWNWSCN